MKPKDQLYKEAVERSKGNMNRWTNALTKEGHDHVSPDKRLPALKNKLGIRADDTNMDSDLNAAIKKAEETNAKN